MSQGKLPRVLVISSVNPLKGTGTVAYNFYRALKNAGIEADFLTKDPVPGHPEILYVLPEPRRRTLREHFQALRSHYLGRFIGQKGEHSFDYGREENPPVDPRLITRRITKPYDVVFIVFWYRLLSYRTVEAIYDKLHCQIHFRCPDNHPVAGGCHFIGDCPRYSEGCGFCPGLRDGSAHDFTASNILERKRILEKVKPIVYGNTHMQRIHARGALLKRYDRLETVYPLVDNVFFHPIPKEEARKQLGIDPGKRFVLFFGANSLTEERKGMSYLINALKVFKSAIKDKADEVLLLVAGHHAGTLLESLPFETRNLGYIPFKDLPVVYSAASAFLCPSTDDAGPSMVNQALSCGTPVVAFEIGTALDMVLGHNTGFCAKLRDSKDFAKGILGLFNASPDEYAAICSACRDIALERTTEESFVQNFLSVYRKYQ